MILSQRFAVAIVGIFVVASNGHVVSAATFHVSPFGSNTPPFDTYTKAASHPRDAVQATSGVGDTVFLHTGTYDIDTTIDLPKGVVFTGVHRDSVSVVYRGIPILAFTINALGDNVLSGIEFVNPVGNEIPGTKAILQSTNSGSLLVRQCRFDRAGIFSSSPVDESREISECEFIVFGGVGIWVSVGGPMRIHHNTFVSGRNISGAGRGIIVEDGQVVIDHNVFDWRPARDNGTPIYVLQYPQHVTLRNNLILGGQWSLIWIWTDGLIENNTVVSIADNLISQFSGDTLTLRNNVFTGLETGPCYACPPDAPIPTTFNAFWPPVTILDTVNFNALPMFADDSLFYLQYGSPLIDAGDPSILDPDGSRSDIGWTGGPEGMTYEYLDLPPLAPETLSISGVDTVATLTWQQRHETDLSGYRLYRGHSAGFWMPGMAPDDEFDTASLETTQLVSIGDTAYFVVTSFDQSGLESGPSMEVLYSGIEVLINHPPEWLDIAPQELAVGDSLVIEVAATDPDGDTLTLVATNLPANASFEEADAGLGVFAFNPDSTQVGQHTATFVVTDGRLDDTLSFIITVALPSAHIGIIKVYPNPLNELGTTEVSLPGGGAVQMNITLVLYDITGRRVAECYSGTLSGGVHSLPLDLSASYIGKDLASGVYLLGMSAGDRMFDIAKIAVLK